VFPPEVAACDEEDAGSWLSNAVCSVRDAVPLLRDAGLLLAFAVCNLAAWLRRLSRPVRLFQTTGAWERISESGTTIARFDRMIVTPLASSSLRMKSPRMTRRSSGASFFSRS
jgi:hypothetical protein